MKKLSIILVLIMLVGLFSSCEGIGDSSLEDSEKNKIFEFSYEIEKSEYLRGEEIQIKTYVKNISGRAQKYMGCSGNDYIPWAELYYLTDDGAYGGNLEEYNALQFPCDEVEKTIKKGAVGSHTYVFKIPTDAVCGEYSLKLWRGDDSRVFENILRVTDTTSQNENEKYKYSSITVSSAGKTVNPIRTGTSCYIQHADGTVAIGCDGLGVWQYFRDDDTDVSTFPLLVYEGGLDIEIPEYTKITRTSIYGLNYEELHSDFSVRELDYLPAGEYLVVFSVSYDTKPRDPNAYEQYSYQDFFRLTVPSKSAEKTEYNYSSVMIQSGDFDIRPIQCMLWVEEHKKEGALSYDGSGVYKIIRDKEDHSGFPTIFYKGNLQVYPPVNVNLYTAKVKVYDTDYNELKYSFEKIEDISTLLPGEYLIVFREVADGRGCDPDITEYSVRCNECIFKFIVPESSIGSFSFDNISKTYKAGEPGVISQGFKNTSESSVTNSTEAAERAKNECTIEYDTVTVLYDDWDNIWSVTFSTRGTLGGCQTVYLDSKGVALLIVYGE